MLARIVGAVVEHGPHPGAEALEQAFDVGRCDLLALERDAVPPPAVEVPERLAAYLRPPVASGLPSSPT